MLLKKRTKESNFFLIFNYKLLLLIIWMFVIFSFSNESGIKSTYKSDRVLYSTSRVFGIKINKKNYIKYVKIIRKSAHVFIYFILGVLAFNYFSEIISFKYLFLCIILFCLIYSISDEVHQVFIPGRSFGIIDLLIDSFGYLLSSFCWRIYEKEKRTS